MNAAIYTDLVDFYHLLDPLEDHADEAELLAKPLVEAVPGATSLLELGSGAGHGAHYIKKSFEDVVLSDLSPQMLARSATLNPDCVHVQGDMRTLQLNRQFDCVLVHDAICYLTSPADILAMMASASRHLVPGGAALFVPDCLKETFREDHEDHAGDDGERSLRAISWSYDPDPQDDTHIYDFAFLLRDHSGVRAVHDRHICGLFTAEMWMRLAAESGFRPAAIKRPLPEEYADSAYTDTMFLADCAANHLAAASRGTASPASSAAIASSAWLWPRLRLDAHLFLAPTAPRLASLSAFWRRLLAIKSASSS